MLQAEAGSETSVGDTFVIVPPYFIGVELLFGSPSSAYITPYPELNNITFVDILQETICLYNFSTCPANWGQFKLSDVMQLVTNGSYISSLLGNWQGRVVWPPGRAVTQTVPGAPLRTVNMGVGGLYDLCLAGKYLVVLCACSLHAFLFCEQFHAL